MLRRLHFDNTLVTFILLALVLVLAHGCLPNPEESEPLLGPEDFDLPPDESSSPDPVVTPTWTCNGTYRGGAECGVNELVVNVSEDGDDIMVGGASNDDIDFELIEDPFAPEGMDAVITFEAGGESCRIRCNGLDGASITIRCSGGGGASCEQTLNRAGS